MVTGFELVHRQRNQTAVIGRRLDDGPAALRSSVTARQAVTPLLDQPLPDYTQGRTWLIAGVMRHRQLGAP